MAKIITQPMIDPGILKKLKKPVDMLLSWLARTKCIYMVFCTQKDLYQYERPLYN